MLVHHTCFVWVPSAFCVHIFPHCRSAVPFPCQPHCSAISRKAKFWDLHLPLCSSEFAECNTDFLVPWQTQIHLGKLQETRILEPQFNSRGNKKDQEDNSPLNVFHLGLLHSVILFYKCSVYKNAGGRWGETFIQVPQAHRATFVKPDPVLPAACPQNFAIVETN